MKRVIITGASSGIGKEITKKFHSQGWSVLALARNKERLQRLCQEFKGIEALVCDLSDPKAVIEASQKLNSSPIDALINNAGIYRPEAIDDDSEDTWQSHFQNNLMSAVRITRQCWTSLKQQKGSIVNISSTLGIRPIANTAAYSALKAAMNNWTQCLAIEGAPHGLRANAICPGIIDTPIHSYFHKSTDQEKKIYEAVQKAQPLGRTGQPEDVAAMVLNFCQPEAQWITGTVLNIDGGILLNS